MNTKQLPFLFGCVLAASSLLALPHAQAAEDPVLMPVAVKDFDPNPAAPNSLTTRTVFKYGQAGGVPVPMKLLRITNNTDKTVYPIMRDQNATVLPENSLKGMYNPYDLPRKEYRGYIGYVVGEGANAKYYFGLRSKQSILVRIPLVFWDAARMGIEMSPKYLLSDDRKMPNPLRNDSKAVRTVAMSEPPTGGPDAIYKGVIKDGVVMWYRSDTPNWAVAPADDTEDQLVEWTIRDHGFLSNPDITKETMGSNKKSQIPDNQLVTLINYDVSNVDSLFMPVSMETFDSWVVPQGAGKGDDPNRNSWVSGSMPEPVGWTGSIKEADYLQPYIRRFVENNNKLLGDYFGGKGWPYYNFGGVVISDTTTKLKIPSGANIFPQSPLLDVRSSYADGVDWRQNMYMLSSGGTNSVFVNIGAAGEQGSDKSILTLAPETTKDKTDFLQEGMVVVAYPPERKIVQPGTTIKSIDRSGKAVKLKLDPPMNDDGKNANYDFFRPRSDYAAEAMMKLWFSWAEYYRKNWKLGNPNAKDTGASGVGTIAPLTATLVLQNDTADKLGLVPGMAVRGSGLQNIQTEVDPAQSDVIILKIGGDKKSLTLSQLATGTAAPNSTYQFLPPQELKWTPKAGQPGYPLFVDDLKFDPSQIEPSRKPYEFSQQVFMVMAAMDQIGKYNNNTINKFMQDVIGANMGFIFTNDAKKYPDAPMVMAVIRDMIKSVLRGVSDFTIYPDTVDTKGNHIVWYPDPKVKAKGYTGSKNFNVFNLDPYVWFIHQELGFSGYGFSVDDDTADVGAGGASQLQVTVTGTGGLVNLQQWSIQAPWGPITNFPCTYSGTSADKVNGNTLYFAIVDASNTPTIKITVDPKLKMPLKEGDKVIVESVEGNKGANGIRTAKNVGKSTFELYDSDGQKPIAGTGPYKSGTGRWGLLPYRPSLETGKDLTKVFERIQGDDAEGTFLGAWVSVNGVDRNPTTGERFRVWQRAKRDTGQLLLNTPLTDKSGNPLQAGSLNVTFFGDSNQQ